jgi:hypothetical protein
MSPHRVLFVMVVKLSIAVMQCVIAAKANTRRFVGNMLSAKTQAKLLTKVRELTNTAISGAIATGLL